MAKKGSMSSFMISRLGIKCSRTRKGPAKDEEAVKKALSIKENWKDITNEIRGKDEPDAADKEILKKFIVKMSELYESDDDDESSEHHEDNDVSCEYAVRCELAFRFHRR